MAMLLGNIGINQGISLTFTDDLCRNGYVTESKLLAVRRICQRTSGKLLLQKSKEETFFFPLDAV